MHSTTMLRRVAFGLLFFLLLQARAPAQADADALEAKLARKLRSDFLRKSLWTTDYTVAKARALVREQPIFAYFTRSHAP